MFDFIVQFYKRNKQNKLKHFLLRVSLTIIFVITTSRIAQYVINDLVFKTPKPNLIDNSTNFIYYIFSNEGFAVFSFVILCLFFMDFIFYRRVK